MRRTVYILAVIGFATTVCVLVATLRTVGSGKTQAAARERAQLEQTIADLEGQIRQAQAQKGPAAQTIKRLQDEVLVLAKKREEDRQVIKDLWAMLTTAARQEKEASAAGTKPAQAVKDKGGAAPRVEKKDTKDDIEALKQRLASAGGNLDTVAHQIVTPERLAKTLQDHAGHPAYWAAAASLASDPGTALEYLKEAARLYPDSPAVLSALVSAQMAAGVVDESTLACARELTQLDPTNALGDCYAAQCRFQSGDILGALQSLAQAGTKGRFADDRIAMLMARRDYFLDGGLSDPAALGLSAFTLPLEHLGMIRELGNQSIEQARSLAAVGRTADALKIAADVSNIGQTVSSSGRFLVHDRVGIALQQAGLTEQRQVYTALGNTAKAQEIDSKLQVIQERSTTIDTMSQGFGSVMANMTEADVAAYVNGTILNGEFATLQNIPEIAQALQQAQSSPPKEAVQTTPPQM